MMSSLNVLQEKLGYQFKNADLLQQALTHRSKQKMAHNERLEFLGDSVLSLTISTAIFSRHQQVSEGQLSRLRAALVKGETIAKISFALEVGNYVRLGAGELKSGGVRRESILAGCFEALIGAIYLDSNFETARDCVLRWYGNLIDHIDTVTDVKDAKTQLQEWLQAHRKGLPTYECITQGEAHALQFTVICHVDGFAFQTEGRDTNRRKAEQLAAKQFLEKIHREEKNT